MNKDETRDPMKYYPVFLDVRDRDCLVVGGGSVGARKAQTLLRAGARVTVVSPEFSGDLLEADGLVLAQRGYEETDMEGKFLVFAATNDAALNQRVMADAGAAGILCNGADAPEEGNFILPAVVDRGELICAVSTCGACPALARKIRQELDAAFGPEYAMLTALLGAVRKKLLASGHDPDGHKKIFRRLMTEDLPELIAAREYGAVDEVLNRLLGPGYAFHTLVSDTLLPDAGVDSQEL